MTELDVLMKSLDMAHWEMSEAFGGLQDEDVWKRADPRLLSVGELAAHVAYWEAQSFFGEGFESPLTVAMARYYTTNVDEPFTLALGAEEVLAEVRRVHEACKAAFNAQPPSPDEVNAHRGDWTWAFTIQYQVFHVAYHTGQMYSVRHLLGHETVDN
jgi:hypothetical protein